MLRFWSAVIVLLIALPAAAQPLPAPQGPPLLTIAGRITVSNDDGRALFDRAMLEALPQYDIRTGTPWTDGIDVFRGPRLRDVLERVGAQGTTLHAVALNDYEVEIPIADARDYGVIIAVRRNGVAMSVRQKGPLWIIYPWNEVEQLRREDYYTRSIWQLDRLVVRP